MENKKLLFILLLGIQLCYAKVNGTSEVNTVGTSEKVANTSVPADKQPNISSLQNSFLPTDLSLRSGLGQSLIYIVVATFSFVLVGGLTLLMAPVFGYKICTILGNCDPVVTPYSAGGTLQNPSQSNSFPSADLYGALYPSGPYVGYQKRSLDYTDYMKPIIETLAATYEKKKSR